MYFQHDNLEFESKENIVKFASIAKKYLQKIPCKKDFDEIIAQVPLSPTECEIIIDRFRNFKSIVQISCKLYMSTPTVYTYQRRALAKIYYFLKYRNCI